MKKTALWMLSLTIALSMTACGGNSEKNTETITDTSSVSATVTSLTVESGTEVAVETALVTEADPLYETEDGFVATPNGDGTLSITDYTGNGGDITIPAVIKDLPVTKTADYLFASNNKIKSVVFEEGIKEIGEGALYECQGLRSVTVPASVTSIGMYLCFRCTALSEVVLNEGLQKIGEAAFAQCSMLKSVNVPSTVTDIGPDALPTD